jgi:hypothetical protein
MWAALIGTEIKTAQGAQLLEMHKGADLGAIEG